MLTELRLATRQLLQRPAYGLTVIGVLGLGIGAATAIFSVVHGVLLKPLAYREPQELVQIQSRHPEQGMSVLSPGAFYAVAEQAGLFSHLAAQQYYYTNLTRVAQPARLTEARTTADYFGVFDVTPLLGRTWNADDARAGAAPVVILSATLWRQQFNARPDIVGQSVVLDDVPHTVVGVMPDGFSDPWGNAMLWRLIPLDAGVTSDHRTRYWSTFARLKPELRPADIDRALAPLAARLAANDRANYDKWTFHAEDLHELVVGDYRRGLLVLLGAVGCVLAITCANVAGLALVRAQQRRKELALRAALGAAPGRLVRQLLGESLLLAAAGGGLGILLANWGVALVLSLLGNGWLPRSHEVAVDQPVLLAALALSLGTGLAFGLLPAWRAARVDAGEALKDGSERGSAGPAGRRLRAGLVTAEIALAATLLVGAGLLGRSLFTMLHRDAGIRTEQVTAFGLSLAENRYHTSETMRNFYLSVEQAVAAVPGVESAAFTQTLPFTWGIPANLVPVEAGRVTDDNAPSVFYDSVSDDFFRTTEVRILAGRSFEPRDDANGAPVAIVSAATARALFGDAPAVGRHFRAAGAAAGTAVEIIGVSADVLRTGLSESATPLQAYRPIRQRPTAFATLLVRTRTASADISAAVRAAIAGVDPDQAIESFPPLTRIAANTVTLPRLYLTLFVAFAGLAVLLAGIGLYGLVAYGVSRRAREFGIRAALGASPAGLLRLVLREGLILGALGIVAGLAAALGAGRALASLLYATSPFEPAVFAGVAVVLLAVTLLACWLPARRATKVDPSVALRTE